MLLSFTTSSDEHISAALTLLTSNITKYIKVRKMKTLWFYFLIILLIDFVLGPRIDYSSTCALCTSSSAPQSSHKKRNLESKEKR